MNEEKLLKKLLIEELKELPKYDNSTYFEIQKNTIFVKNPLAFEFEFLFSKFGRLLKRNIFYTKITEKLFELEIDEIYLDFDYISKKRTEFFEEEYSKKIVDSLFIMKSNNGNNVLRFLLYDGHKYVCDAYGINGTMSFISYFTESSINHIIDLIKQNYEPDFIEISLNKIEENIFHLRGYK